MFLGNLLGRNQIDTMSITRTFVVLDSYFCKLCKLYFCENTGKVVDACNTLFLRNGQSHQSVQGTQVMLSFATVTLHIVQNSKVHVDFYFKSDYMQNYFGEKL